MLGNKVGALQVDNKAKSKNKTMGKIQTEQNLIQSLRK